MIAYNVEIFAKQMLCKKSRLYLVQGHGYAVDQTVVVSKLIVCGQNLGQPRWIKGVFVSAA